MHLYTRYTDIPVAADRRERQVAGLVYQGMTIAVMLLLLGSLWAF
jgi:hypothetical protein